MDLIILLLGIAIIGAVAYALTTYLQMSPVFKQLIYLVAAIALVLWLVRHFAHSIPNVLQ